MRPSPAGRLSARAGFDQRPVDHHFFFFFYPASKSALMKPRGCEMGGGRVRHSSA